MAHDELVGNIDTAFLVDYFGERNLLGPLDREALGQCMRLADEIFAGTNA
jgi:hydroxymethylglutaryl-CoA lyase